MNDGKEESDGQQLNKRKEEERMKGRKEGGMG